MMTLEDIRWLDTPAGMLEVEENLGRDPLRVALDKKLSHPALTASQVKYLRRAERKLPSYHAARCIIPPRAFEQSSSEATAAMKVYGGQTCIDLTCGLGVDSFALSRNFTEVVAVELDPVTALVAEINFRRLGAGNIKVVNCSAEDYLASLGSGELRADMIYADPDRRPGNGRRQVVLRECTPDVTSLMPKMLKAARRVVIKVSPMFDVAEAFRIFPKSRVSVVSRGGECKEVLIETGEGVDSPLLCAAVSGGWSGCFPYPVSEVPVAEFTPPYDYLVVPDVALRKARITEATFSEILPGAYVTPGSGYVFVHRGTDGKLPVMQKNIGTAIPGRIFEIDWMLRYRPSELRRELAGRNITNADILLVGFPLSTSEICRDLRIKEGGTLSLAFTRAGGELWSIGLKEVHLG